MGSSSQAGVFVALTLLASTVCAETPTAPHADALRPETVRTETQPAVTPLSCDEPALEVTEWTISDTTNEEVLVEGVLQNVGNIDLNRVRLQIGLQDADTRTLYGIASLRQTKLAPRAGTRFEARFPLPWSIYRLDLQANGCPDPISSQQSALLR